MKDSFGNKLPNSGWLYSNDNGGGLGKALAINTFLLAVQVAMDKGNLVRYDKERKVATITDEKGFISTVSH